MDRKKPVKLMIAVVLALAVAITPALNSLPVQATSLSQLQKKQKDLIRQKQQNDALIKSLKADKTQKIKYKDTLGVQINNVSSQIDNLNDQISSLDKNITDKQKQISQKQASIKKNFDVLKQRLRALYLSGEASSLEIIFSAKNVTDFADKAEALRTITTHDTKLINSLKTDLQQIQKQKKEIEENRAQVASAKKDLDEKSSELSGLVTEVQTVISQINANESAAKSKSAELDKRRKEADAAIDKWYRDYYEAQRNKGTSGSGGYVSKGQFAWPVPGYTHLTSYWGDGRNHKGIDIASSGIYGKPIVAADSGKVMLAVHSGWGGGYGLCVYLDNGGGYSTRYGHMSRVVVNTGDVVKKGQVIGYVGSTGDSSGPHLHFEIRVNGVAKNPMNWFSR